MAFARPRLIWVLGIALVLAAPPACGGSGHSAASVLVVSDCFTGHARPGQIVLACGDGNSIATNLRWSTWTAQLAEGRGVISQNNCDPDCARGRFIDYPAVLNLSEVMHTGGHPYFTRITVNYDGANPSGQRVELRKDCADTPPNASFPRCPADLQGAP